jgi:acetylornithine deacetylase/succinyl-diaminopimelate desuccinylase-like protein
MGSPNRSAIVAAALAAVDVDLAVTLTQEFVRIPTVLGEEGPGAQYLQRTMDALGFPSTTLQEIEPERYNAVGLWDTERPGPTVVLTGHIDTKPTSVGWDRDPFGGQLESDRLYGHGIMDMKAGLICQIVAIKAVMDAGLDLHGRVYAAAVCDHMGQQQGSIRFFQDVAADMAVLGELSDLEIYVGHRGRYYFDITTIGRSAHTCHKHQAINAIAKAVDVVQEIEPIVYKPDIDDATRQLFGDELFMACGRIYGGLPPGGPSMIPDECTIRVDTRPQPGVSLEETQSVIDAALKRVESRDPEFQARVEVADVKAPHLISPDSRVYQLMRQAVSEVTGRDPQPRAASWLGDTSSFGSQVPTVIYGPGREPVYMPNEYLDLSDIHEATRVYAAWTALALNAANGATT